MITSITEAAAAVTGRYVSDFTGIFRSGNFDPANETNRKMKKCLFVFAALCFLTAPSHAQKWALETNAVDWANFGTVNFSAERKLNRYSAAVAGVRYNPWRFMDSEGKSSFNRAATANVGVSFWPWHIYSGWWFSAKAQAEIFSRGNILTFRELDEGYSVGLSVSAGYALMVGENWNISFGAGGWAGYSDRTRYRCPDCGRRLSRTRGLFALPDNGTKVAVMYIF